MIAEKEKRLISILRRWFVLDNIIHQFSENDIEIIRNIALGNKSYADAAKGMKITASRYRCKIEHIKEKLSDMIFDQVI